MPDEFDYVVAGGGSSGAIVAARLAEGGHATVCLLEAGPTDEGDVRITDVRNWLSLAGSELARDFAVEPQARGNSRLVHSRAYVLGGCGSHNQAIAFRAPRSDLRTWEELGAGGWGPHGTERSFERVLRRVGVESAPEENPCAAAFVQAGQEAGLPRVSFQDPDLREGVGWFRLDVRGNLRQSSSVAYLHPLAQLPANLVVRTRTTAHRVLLEDGRAVGVATTAGLVRARREIVLSCGAFETPKLLLHSGIGPADHLRTLGIPVELDLPGVGEHLLDHPESTLIWKASRAVPTGVGTDWEAGLIARSDAALDRPDLMMHFGTMPAEAAWLPPGTPSTEHAFWLTPNVARPKSVGRLRLRSADPADPPLIDPRYYTDAEGHDERVMVAGFRLARRLAAQPALAAWADRELLPGDGVRSDAEISEYVRRQGTTVHHPAGTCRLGAAADPLAVVGPDLRVRGIGGLRVADASVFPSMISVNINLTCMMIGEKCAELVRQSRR